MVFSIMWPSGQTWGWLLSGVLTGGERGKISGTAQQGMQTDVWVLSTSFEMCWSHHIFQVVWETRRQTRWFLQPGPYSAAMYRPVEQDGENCSSFVLREIIQWGQTDFQSDCRADAPKSHLWLICGFRSPSLIAVEPRYTKASVPPKVILSPLLVHN